MAESLFVGCNFVCGICKLKSIKKGKNLKSPKNLKHGKKPRFLPALHQSVVFIFRTRCMLSDLLVFIIRSDMRVSLSQQTLNDFLFVKESMGLVATFDPRQNCKILQNPLQNG